MTARRGGAVLIVLCGLLTLLAPALAPNPPSMQFDDRSYAPPMRVHLWHDGHWRGPFVYPQMLRDRMMRELDALHPGYEFAQHKGYATELHLERLKAHGPCPIHRRSFLPVRQAEFTFS